MQDASHFLYGRFMEDPLKLALQIAIRALARRDRSSAELQDYLVQKEVLKEHAAATVQRVQTMGYVNDEKLRQGLARSTASSRRGPGHLWAKLTKRGIPTSRQDAAKLYADALGTESSSGETEKEIIEREGERMWVSVSRRETDVRKARQKVAARLIRRGFSQSLVFDVCARYGR
mgnify:CR=1 FL=1